MIWKKQPVGSKLAELQNNKAGKNAATQSAAGLMSAADKKKLDEIENGATAVSVVNNLNSDSTTSALSAAQGKALNSKLTPKIENINSVSIEADSYVDGNVSTAKGFAIVGFQVHGGYHGLYFQRLTISQETGISYRLRNDSTTARSPNLTIYYL